MIELGSHIHPRNSTDVLMDVYCYSAPSVRKDIKTAITNSCDHELQTEEDTYNTIRCLNPLQVERVLEEGLARVVDSGVDTEHYINVCVQSVELMTDTQQSCP